MANMRYTTAMHIDLQDPDKFSEIERIKVRLFEDNTRDIFAGKLVTITRKSSCCKRKRQS